MACQQILASVFEGAPGGAFFVEGPGGTGKTFVYHTLCHAVRARGKIALCVASSGIAALLLEGGRTAHSMLAIPIPILPDSSLNIPKQSHKAELLRQADLILWDEAPMQDKLCAETVDQSLRDIRAQPDRLFGGLTVVFGGDFQQIPPVIVHGSKPRIIASSLRRSVLWDQLCVVRLTQNMRVLPEELSWMQWLLDVGHGRHTSETADIILPEALCVGSDVKDLIAAVYPDLEQRQPPEYFMDRTIIAPHNDSVDLLNQAMLSVLPGNVHTCWSADSASDRDDGVQGDSRNYTSDFLQSLNISGLPLARLELKTGAPVMVLRNIDPANGLCNGTRGIVLNISRRCVQISIIGGAHHGQKCFIPRITLTPSTESLPFILRRRQFPLRLAFAMSINKSQGQSVQTVGLDLRRPVFGHGQFYVAVSRCTSGSRVKVLLPPNANYKTKNIVWKELLLSPLNV